MRTGIVSNSILCLPLLHHLQAAKEACVVFSAEQGGNSGSAIASFCAGANIPCVQEKSGERSLYDWLNEQQPDVVFIIGYNRRICLNRFTNGMPSLFNVHFGHLPEYRGPNPVFWQLKNGAHTLAITIHRINDQLDAGDIAWKKEYPNESFFSYGYVHQLMSHYLVEGVLYLLQLEKLRQPIPVTPQNERSAAYFGRPGAREVCICWNTMSATTICNLVKACNPWNNGAIASYNGFEVRISDAEQVASNGEMNFLPSGTILSTCNTFLVSCINNEAINIHMLAVNGILMPGRFAADYGFIQGQSFKTASP